MMNKGWIAAGLLTFLGSCSAPPPEAYVGRGGTQAGAPAGNDSRGDACTVQVGRQPPADRPVQRAQEVYCGGWSQAAARIIQLSGSTSAGDLDQLAAGGLWRSWLDQRVTCGPPTSTTVGSGAAARLLTCTRRAGGWPHIGLVIAGPDGPVVADGVATATPVIERIALGQQPSGADGGSRSAAMQLAVTRLAADAFRTGDVGRYEELMRLGAELNQTENFNGAEEAYRAALAVQERVLGRDNPNIVGALLGLAVNISNQQRAREAQILLDRAGELAPRAADRIATARHLHYSGLVTLNRGDAAQAIPVFEAAEQAYTRELPAEALAEGAGAGIVADPIVQSAILGLAEAKRNRALAMVRAGRSTEAGALIAQSRGILRNAGLEASVTIGRSLRTQADAEARSGRAESAARLLEQAANRFAVAVPGERPEAITLFLAGRQRFINGRRAEALSAFRAGSAIVRARQVALPVEAVIPYLDALDAEATNNPGQDQALRAEMFAAAQLAQRGTTARYVQQASARVGAAGGDSRVAEAVRGLQEADRALRTLFTERDSASTSNADLDSRINAAQTRRNEAESEVAAAAPGYRQLLLSAVDAPAVARVLAADEALVTMLLGPRHGYVMAIRGGRVFAARTALGEIEAEQRVQRLRASIELNQQGQVPEFSIAESRALYDGLIAPVAAATEGAATLIIAPDGPLLSVPFGLLLAGPAERDALNTAPFLIRRHAIVHVPSPQTLATLRSATGGSAAPLPYIGFGNFSPPSQAQLARSFPADRCGQDARNASGLARLPGTRAEVLAARQLTGASPDSVIMGADFTQARFRAANLGQYRIVHLATHALLAGEINCLPEPTIVLTAPANAPDANASFMRASEVMNIRMDADLVILSACNTGGAAGAGGEALSGLARSFFYAGARGLLITHWAVDDGAASLIVADSIRRQGLEGGTSAAALRGAQNLLLDEAGRRLPASFAHPYYWAAFALIGDGKRVSSTVPLRRASIDSLAGRIL
ncbi:MAG: hypothetical protein JWO24_3113 [Rhodospirillales bacterium]|nr:hypothetical protein [Rhodospirillales bacterium]